jgi:hypothetical protein
MNALPGHADLAGDSVWAPLANTSAARRGLASRGGVLHQDWAAGGRHRQMLTYHQPSRNLPHELSSRPCGDAFGAPPACLF